MSSFANLALDQKGNPIQALSPDPVGVAKVAIGAASAAVALPVDCDVVRLANNVSCYFKFGTVGVTAAITDSLSPPGVDIVRIPTGATHIAVIQDGAVTGAMTITRMV